MLGRREFLMSSLAAVAAAARPAGAAAELVGAAPPIIDGLGELHLTYPMELVDQIRASGMRAMAVTVGNPALHGSTAFESMASEIRGYERHIAAHPDRLSRVTSLADLDRAVERGTIGLIFYPQNATPIEDDVNRLDTLHSLGVRILQLTYNTRNLIGDGYTERQNSGLSAFGLQVVQRMNELGMLVDVSHTGEASTLEAIQLSRAPVAVTHAGCRAVFDHPRNKSDRVLRALAERGGVFGVLQINPFIGPKERNDLNDYLRHIDHAVQVAGVEHVGIGSDREHRTIPDTDEERDALIRELSRLRPVNPATFRWPYFIAELNHPRRMETIRDGLRRKGYPQDQIDRILGGNWRRLFGEVWG